MKSSRKLRRVIRLGNTSLAVTLPPTWLEGWQYVWIEREEEAIIIKPAEVK